MELVKDTLKGSAIYYYHILHPEDEFVEALMNQSSSSIPILVRGRSLFRHTHCHCYLSILKNNRIDIIYDIILHMDKNEMQPLAITAIDEHNNEILELLYKHEFDITTWGNEDITSLLRYAYGKHGFEIIKSISKIGFSFNYVYIFSDFFMNNDQEALDYAIETLTTTKSLDELLGHVFYSDSDTKLLIEYFIDKKIDVMKYKNQIFNRISGSTVDYVRSILDLGITIDSNEPLRYASYKKNFELMEFYLEYGLQVDKNMLEDALFEDDDDYVDSSCKSLVDLFLEYNVDFSILNYNINYEFLAKLENHGLNRDMLLPGIFYI